MISARREMIEALEEMERLSRWADEGGDATAATFALAFAEARKRARNAALRYLAETKEAEA